MRELGRGGALVAAAVAQLENKANTRLMKTLSSSRNGTASSAVPIKTKIDKKEAQESSGSEEEEEEEDKETKVAVSDKDSSVKSSRDTSEVEEVSSSSSSTESDSESDEDRTQGSVLENVVVDQEPKITSPERG